MEDYAIVKQIRFHLGLEVRVNHMFKEANLCVDKLAKVGIECAKDREFQDEIPNFI